MSLSRTAEEMVPLCSAAEPEGRSQAECWWLLAPAHTEPADSGFHGAVGVSAQTDALQSHSPGAAFQNTADTAR
jgi:hypothetical protein